MANEHARKRHTPDLGKDQGPPEESRKPDPGPSFPKARIVYRVYRAYKEGNKMKPILQSNTTKTVAAAGVVSVGLASGVIAGARGVLGDLPWSADMDQTVAMAATAVLTPIFSWIVAKFRKG